MGKDSTWRSTRKGDIKLIVGATVAVLLVGFFIAGAMIMTTERVGPAVRTAQHRARRPTSATP